MRKILLILFFAAFEISACTSAKITAPVPKTLQGIEGRVLKVSGNLLPSTRAKPSSLPGIATTIYIYEATNLKEVTQLNSSPFYQFIKTKLITTVQSDSTGHFLVQLPAGNYSVFTKINNFFYANSFDENNNIALVKVEEGKLSTTTIKMDAEATY
jgi:hypothetical protein